MRRRGVLQWLPLAALTEALCPGTSSAEEKKPAASVPIRTVKVPGDRNIEVAFGPHDASDVILYLHGVCGDPLAFESWAAAASERSTFISLRGDLKCDKRKGRYKWSYDFVRMNRRIDRAIDAAEKLREDLVDSNMPAKLDRDEVVIIGYSQGAHRVESMAHRFPERFARIAMIAPARAPEASKLKESERVLLIAGEKDAKKHIQDGRDALAKQGNAVKYLELPGARHGEYGPKAQLVMAQGLDWLYK